MWFDCRESSICGAGRGVFTKRSFKEGDIVMSSPILRFPMTDLNKGAVIKQYNGNIGDGTGFYALIGKDLLIQHLLINVMFGQHGE